MRTKTDKPNNWRATFFTFALFAAVLLSAGTVFAGLPVNKAALIPSGATGQGPQGMQGPQSPQARIEQPQFDRQDRDMPQWEQLPNGGCLSWRVVSTPYDGSSFDHLYSISALSNNDIWAVGDTTTDILILRWNGTEWNIVSTPIPGSLRAVMALAADNVWAVGFSGTGDEARTLIMHWDGTAWSSVTSPNPGTGGNELHGIAAAAPNDIWAVGGYDESQTLIVRWDGTNWTQVLGANPGTGNNSLRGVTVVAANDVWAVGSYNNGGSDLTLIERWDGTQWSVVASPNIGDESNNLRGIGAAAADNIFAVGSYLNNGEARTLTLRWTGTQWSVIYSPNASVSNLLYNVTVVAANEIWAVGDYSGGGLSARRTLAMKWTGMAWGRISTLNVGSRNNSLRGVTFTGPGDIWTAGNYDNTSAYQTLVERYSAGVCPSPTPTRTGTPPTATRTATPICGLGWRTVNSPNPGTGDNRMNGVVAITAIDAWAVGTSAGRVMTQRWNGLAWSNHASPNVGSYSNVLYGVAATSEADVWAVGGYSNGISDYTLVEHWDGTAWSIIPSPNVGTLSNVLYGVGGLTDTDVWAVGSSGDGTETLIMHWDGTAWNAIASPNSGTNGNVLRSVTALGADNIWAAGYMNNGSNDLTLIEHWNGSEWEIIPSPNPGAGDNRLYSISAVSANNIWAVGQADDQPLTMRWNGSTWTVIPSPPLAASSLYGVDALSPNDAWAVGREAGIATLVIHWNGSSWTRVPSPNPSVSSNNLYAISATAPNDIWAVGYMNTTGQTLVERYIDFCFLTPIALTATSTRTPTSTPVNTPVSRCPGERFLDVCPDDYFYTAALYLSNMGAITGYSDGTFRPTQFTTRGQLCKIIVLAVDWELDTTGGPHFTDVPTSNTFYPFIETAYNRGIIAGYGDSTFRWRNNVTRAQLSKIIVTAKEWDLYRPSNPTFHDVPVANSFYGFIETAYLHNIISGYSDGTFQPGNTATRGQISKIVYLAVTQP